MLLTRGIQISFPPGSCSVSEGLMHICFILQSLTPFHMFFSSESHKQGTVWQQTLYLSYGQLVLLFTVVSFLSPISQTNSE